MLDIIIANAGRQMQEVIESDALATAVRDFIERRRCWEGTATELHAALSEPYLHPKILPEGWPKSLSFRIGKALVSCARSAPNRD